MLRALTLSQPWATIVSDGTKRVENRSWPCPPHIIGKRIALHAGKKWDRKGYNYIKDVTGRCIDRTLIPYGAIIAVATVVRCYLHADELGAALLAGCDADPGAPWAFGPWCWDLDDINELVEPVPCKGMLGLWKVPSEVAVRMRMKRSSR